LSFFLESLAEGGLGIKLSGTLRQQLLTRFSLLFGGLLKLCSQIFRLLPSYAHLFLEGLFLAFFDSELFFELI